MSQTTTRERVPMQAPTMTPEERRGLAKTVARDAGGANVAAFFDAQKAGLAQLLPQHMSTDRFLRITLNALRVTPKLMDCTLESLFGATIFCAQVGLEPNTPQGHVYLIPFKNNRQNRTEVQVIIGYQGLIALARRTGEIASISAQAVYERDDFEIDYMNPEDCRHKPMLDGDRGKIVGAWAKATFKDGGMAFDFMPVADIEKIRNGSQGYQTAIKFKNDRSPWITNFSEMAVKTAIRRLAKRLPMSIEMATAVALDERDDRRSSQGLHGLYQRAVSGEGFDMAAVATEVPEDEGAGDDRPPEVSPPEGDQGRQQETGRNGAAGQQAESKAAEDGKGDTTSAPSKPRKKTEQAKLFQTWVEEHGLAGAVGLAQQENMPVPDAYAEKVAAMREAQARARSDADLNQPARREDNGKAEQQQRAESPHDENGEIVGEHAAGGGVDEQASQGEAASGPADDTFRFGS